LGRNKESSFVDKTIADIAETDLELLPNGIVAMRLLAIIAAGRGMRMSEIAEFLRATRQSVAKWIANYKSGGLAGISDKPKGHRVKRLSEDQEKKIQNWLDQGKSPLGEHYYWTVDRIKSAIEEQFDVVLSRSRVGYLIQEWGFRPKVPRPKHAQSDKAAQVAFKKNSPKR
jgi:transposase